MLKILHARLQQYMNRELPDSTWTENFQMYKLDLEKAGFRGTRDQIVFDCVDHKKTGKFWKR